MKPLRNDVNSRGESSSRGVVAAPWATGLYRTLRGLVPWSVADPHGVLERAGQGEALLFCCRHGQLLPLLWAMEPYDLSILVSRSRDGELLAEILRRRGFSLVRGSTSRGGHAAARGGLRTLRSGGRLGMAVDGPRGPRGGVQEGVLRLARRADVPVVPLRVVSGLRFPMPRSWDRFELPLPGRPLVVSVEAPLRVGSGPGALARAGHNLALALGGWCDIPDGVAVPSYAHP